MTKPGPGKFEACESEEIAVFLYGQFPDDELGDSETFGWYGLITGIDNLILQIKESIIAQDLDAFFDFEGSEMKNLKPAYIVQEETNGFFTYKGFDSDADARKSWKKLTDEYLDFVKAEDVEVS